MKNFVAILSVDWYNLVNEEKRAAFFPNIFQIYDDYEKREKKNE